MVSVQKIEIKKLKHADSLSEPVYATHGSAGLDLTAANSEDIVINKMSIQIIPTGICIGLPLGFEAQIRPRSGLAAKHGLTVLNTPGTIDSDYRGEIKIIMINLGAEDFVVTRGMRIAQLVIKRYEKIKWSVVDVLQDTERNDGGFGSTGL